MNIITIVSTVLDDDEKINKWNNIASHTMIDSSSTPAMIQATRTISSSGYLEVIHSSLRRGTNSCLLSST